MNKTEMQNRITELEQEVQEKNFVIERWENREESLRQWQRNLRKEEERQKETYRDFLERVENGVQIRTIGLQHELKVANYKLEALEIQHAEVQSLV